MDGIAAWRVRWMVCQCMLRNAGQRDLGLLVQVNFDRAPV